MKLYMKRFDLLTVYERIDMAIWCQDTFGHQLTDQWWVDGNTFYFRDEKLYTFFSLRWNRTELAKNI